MEEPELIAALKRGNENAYEQLVDDYQDAVYHIVLKMLQHEEDARDITQEVFIAIFNSVKTFRNEAKLSTWIYRIAVTKSLEHLRKAQSSKRTAQIESLNLDDTRRADVPHFHHPGVQLENKEKGAIMFQAIGQLPENQKVAFLLSQKEGLSQTDIATVMEISQSSVESLIFRARKKLRLLLSDYYEHHLK